MEDQATDHPFRIGQRRDVQVHKFICIGTLEETIDEMIERKTGLADSVIGDGEGWLNEWLPPTCAACWRCAQRPGRKL